MADDNTKSGSGGFDDWLDEKPGPATDPYKELGDDDAEEISDWLAFTEGAQPDQSEEPDQSEVQDKPVDVAVTETPQIDSSSTGEIDMPDTKDDQIARDLVADEAETVEIDAIASDSATEPDNAAPFDFVDVEKASSDQTTDSDQGEDTGELEVIPIAPYGGFSDEPAPATSQPRELFDLSETDYLATATTEHSDLAEAIAVASTQDTEQVPIAAPIPGMADSTVGFEDVVEAEGIGRVRARASGDLMARVITAVVLILALGASLLWRPALAIFAVSVFVLGASEFYTSLVRAGRKPIGIFGFVGIVGASAGAYFWGALAIPAAFFLAIAMLLLFYAVVPGKADPLGNLALTITVMVWVGLGGYAMLIAVSEDYRPLIIGVVVTVAAMDIGQYFVGRAIGRTKLSPWISPKKTVEGLIAGVFIAMVFGALLHFVEPYELTSGLALGAAVAILSPIGDLSMSAAKRSLNIKDMGSVLPGHGGFLDRIDGLLFVIPAAWVIFEWADLL